MSIPEIQRYYEYNSGYLCPSCRCISQNFDDFLKFHKSHAGYFKEDKSFYAPTALPAYIWHQSVCQQESYYKLHGKYLCPNCETFTNNFELFKQLHKDHAGLFLRPKMLYYQNQPSFVCSYCNKNFGSRFSLTRHQKNFHHNNCQREVSFVCKQCNKTFSTRFALHRHEKCFHSSLFGRVSKQQTSFICNRCSKSLASRFSLVRHEQRFH